MRGERRSVFILFILIAFTFLSSITSFADTTTYQYDDNARKVRIEHGTPGAQNFFLSVGKSGAGSGTVTSTDAKISCGSDCGESYAPGSVVTLNASADSGSTFTGWSGACSGTGTCTVTMNEE